MNYVAVSPWGFVGKARTLVGGRQRAGKVAEINHRGRAITIGIKFLLTERSQKHRIQGRGKIRFFFCFFFCRNANDETVQIDLRCDSNTMQRQVDLSFVLRLAAGIISCCCVYKFPRSIVQHSTQRYIRRLVPYFYQQTICLKATGQGRTNGCTL